METYTFVALVAQFLGVMGIVAMLERQRRIQHAHFDQLHQMLAGCLDALRTLVQQQKSVDATLVREADKLSELSAARSKDLLAEAQRTTKAVEALKTSLEESVKFDTKL